MRILGLGLPVGGIGSDRSPDNVGGVDRTSWQRKRESGAEPEYCYAEPRPFVFPHTVPLSGLWSKNPAKPLWRTSSAIYVIARLERAGKPARYYVEITGKVLAILADPARERVRVALLRGPVRAFKVLFNRYLQDGSADRKVEVNPDGFVRRPLLDR